jgi:hypothetical protein
MATSRSVLLDWYISGPFQTVFERFTKVRPDVRDLTEKVMSKIKESGIEKLDACGHQICALLVDDTLNSRHIQVVIFIIGKQNCLKFDTFEVREKIFPAASFTFQ